jgi:hypothetical protein
MLPMGIFASWDNCQRRSENQHDKISFFCGTISKRNKAVKPAINLLIAILLSASVEKCRLYHYCNRLNDICKGAIGTFFFAQTVFLAQVYAERKIAPPDSFSAYRQSVRI